MTSPFPETADVETASEDYAGRFSGNVGNFFLDTQTTLTLELMGPWPGARVLDVGGGHAQITVPLVTGGHAVTVTGSDESCRQRLDRFLEPGSFDFRVCDMLELPFADCEFDVVVAFRLLPHVERWPRLVAEMCRVARQAVIVDYPDKRSFNLVSSALFSAKKAVETNTRPYRCFTRGEVLGELARHGFGRPELRPEFFFPMVIHRALRNAAISRGMESVSGRLALNRLFGSPVIVRVLRDGEPAGGGDPGAGG